MTRQHVDAQAAAEAVIFQSIPAAGQIRDATDARLLVEKWLPALKPSQQQAVTHHVMRMLGVQQGALR